MKNAKFTVLCVGMLFAATTSALADTPADGKKLPRVLLIGDSICGGYHKRVIKALEGAAEVVKIPGNGQHTRTGMAKLDSWLGRAKWDVIHFNWGLWDIAYRNPESKNFGRLDKKSGKLTTPSNEYGIHLRSLVKRLKATGAVLIWAHTTPVPQGEPGRKVGDAAKYNAIAAKVMAEHRVAINDLHKAASDQGYPKKPDVHDLPDLSGHVVSAIKKALASLIPPANSFSFKAIDFDRGVVEACHEVSGEANAGPGVRTPKPAWRQKKPSNAEYDVVLPMDATYTLQIKYSLRQSYPVSLWVDGKKLAENICARSTGFLGSEYAEWEDVAALKLPAGKHTFDIRAERFLPRMTDLRFVADRPLPGGWACKRPKRELSAREYVSRYGGYLRKPSDKIAPNELAALRRGIESLIKTHGGKYRRGGEFLARMTAIEKEPADTAGRRARLDRLKADALLANPKLDFEKILLVRRKAHNLALPNNFESNSSLNRRDGLRQLDDALMTASLEAIRRAPGKATPEMVYQSYRRYVGEVDLHFDGKKVLFSTFDYTDPAYRRRPKWDIHEMDLAERIPRPVTGGDPEIDNYDACYLPSGKIAYTSTAAFTGVPCLYGDPHVANLFICDGNGKNARQLGFDQDHAWSPTVLGNGRLLYQRWEYTDTPHTYSRLLFHCNPDGTNQTEYYGSNSYWPNSMFYARPIPGHATKVIAIVGGHHDPPRQGELVIFDPALGRHEADGAVQRIPGYGKKVEPVIKDQLTIFSWPKFLHLYPLSETTFLVAARPSKTSLWGLYLVDVFDNMLLLAEHQTYALFEPVPLKPRGKPPVIPDRIDLKRTDADVFITDVYEGPGLKGVKRGDVKTLRVFTYNYGFRNIGGLPGVVGNDGPWDVKEVLGTVPVKADGSVWFRVPANTPIAVLPLDKDGAAMQVMRSWFTAMPGETVSCSGCHESQNSAAPTGRKTMAMSQKTPDKLTGWRGPRRGFSFNREVQPVLDKYCLGCHNGKPRPDGKKLKNFSADNPLRNYTLNQPGQWIGRMKAHCKERFTVGYFELAARVRRPGIESDYHLLEPMEFHASTTELVQMLRKGHHGVKLNAEAWDRLYTWIDMNCPYYGTWGEASGGTKPGKLSERRQEMLKLYTNIDTPHNPDKIYQTVTGLTGDPIVPPKSKRAVGPEPKCSGWPFDAATARAMQAKAAANGKPQMTLDLGGGVKMRFVRIPSGSYVMGSPSGPADETPRKASVAKPFWMGVFEVTNAQYARFDPKHDSRYESFHNIQFASRGYPMNAPAQPVVRLTQGRAAEFCKWLAAKTGKPAALPSETQWEWACRAGTSTPLWYGGLDADFGKFANFSDTTMTRFVAYPYWTPGTKPIQLKPHDEFPKNRTALSPFEDWIPKDARFNDGALVTIAPGGYKANPWGLHDMHGNVAEWTRSDFDTSRKVVRGGSWYNRPMRGASGRRWGYLPYQKVFDVGFRVIIEE